MLRLALALLLFGSPASASLVVCNALGAPASVAVGYRADGTWISQGWWRTEPGTCVTVIREALSNRFYYWRAELATGPLNDGPYRFCTRQRLFKIEGDHDCAARGYERSAFNRLDRGRAAKYVLTLRPPQ